MFSTPLQTGSRHFHAIVFVGFRANGMRYIRYGPWTCREPSCAEQEGVPETVQWPTEALAAEAAAERYAAFVRWLGEVGVPLAAKEG
jgi:hypothetical protein